MFSSSMLALSSSAAWVRRDDGSLALSLLAQSGLRGGTSGQRPIGRVCGVTLGFRGAKSGRRIRRGIGSCGQPGGGLRGSTRGRADRGHVGGGRGLGRGPRVGAVVEVHGRTTGDDDRVAPAGRGRRGVRGGLDGSVVEDGGRGRLGLRRCARRLVGGLRVAGVAEDREGTLARGCITLRGRGMGGLGRIGGSLGERAGGAFGQRGTLGGPGILNLGDRCRCGHDRLVASDRRHRRGGGPPGFLRLGSGFGGAHGLGPPCILGFGRGLQLGFRRTGWLRPAGVSRLRIALGCRLRGGLIKRGRLRDPAAGLGRLRGRAGVRRLRRRAGRRGAARCLPDLRGYAHSQAGDLVDGLFDIGRAGAA